jgi:uncharacterized membrane protein YfcA
LTGLQLATLVLASAGGGFMNALAGGGTLLTFPTLVLLGVPAIRANATSTVALLPGAMASIFGYRRDVATHRAWLKTLFVPSLLGGAFGSWLLLATPERTFAGLAPYLVLFATLLFLVQAVRGHAPTAEPAAASLDRRRWIVASLGQLAIAVYGGYFGAGIGILMLATLGFMGLTDIHAMNGLKNFFGICINLVAAGYFIARGAVDWPLAIVMLVGAVVGGYAGARFARSIGREKARVAVVVIGFAITLLLFWRAR